MNTINQTEIISVLGMVHPHVSHPHVSHSSHVSHTSHISHSRPVRATRMPKPTRTIKTNRSKVPHSKSTKSGHTSHSVKPKTNTSKTNVSPMRSETVTHRQSWLPYWLLWNSRGKTKTTETEPSRKEFDNKDQGSGVSGWTVMSVVVGIIAMGGVIAGVIRKKKVGDQ